MLSQEELKEIAEKMGKSCMSTRLGPLGSEELEMYLTLFVKILDEMGYGIYDKERAKGAFRMLRKYEAEASADYNEA